MDMTITITAPVGGNRTYGVSSLSENKSMRAAREPAPTVPETLTISHASASGSRRRSLVKLDKSYVGADGVTYKASLQLVLDRHVASCTEATSDHLIEQLGVLLGTETFTDQLLNGEV